MLVLHFLLLLSFVGCSDSAPVDIDQRGPSLKLPDGSYEMAHRADYIASLLIDSCQVYPFVNVADYVVVSPKFHVQSRHPESGYLKACSTINDQFGGVANYGLVDAFKSPGQLLKIYRYKMTANNTGLPVELRIVLTHENKLTAYRFYDWVDKYVKRKM